MPTPTTIADPTRLARRAREMIEAGRLHAARPLLAALGNIATSSPEIDELRGLLLLREDRPREALAELDAAIGRNPDASGLRICRADARMRLDDFTGAAADAAEAVILSPHSAQAKALLGVILIELGQVGDAVTCLTEAVAAEPLRPAFHQGLAEAQERSGDVAGAAATLAAAIGLLPRHVPLRTAAIMLTMRQRDFAAAATLAATARREGAADACVCGLLGHALSSLGRHDEAQDAYADALKLAPEDPYVRHLVRAGGLLPGADRAPAEYLQTVFNGYAERFEQHLVGLGYRIPGLMRAALVERLHLETATAPTGPVLDLGCGTGLLGVVLSDLPLRPLVGVDISSGMLEQARAKNIYAALHAADIETFLRETDQKWPVVLAADVLIYFGALDRLFSLVRPAMQPRGLFLFSVEELDGSAEAAGGWRLGYQGRYAHTEAYVRDIAAASGFHLRELKQETVRYEAGAPVPGLLVTLERPADDA
jgi:predicted TPR repeat methyltransferase